ncbi:helix-turn-helix transcriptional regulator [Catelliglobosispora koreensis]|uniref:helix-turn-helix transcriptional regulator n=1 Tax=Catelliglobosispora koreensis TaxID=129052 RepID=UPI00036A2738|nr:AraC family transcriptional regulator [Catelliglobosispora koreensis]
MRSFVSLASRPEFSVMAVSCRDDHRGWSEAESRDDFRVVLVRRGRFRRMATGTAADIDPTLAYIGLPGEEERFAHPAGGDVCTSITLTPALWQTITSDTAGITSGTLYVDGRVDLVHRRLLRAAEVGDIDYALTEQLVKLISGVRPKTTSAADRAVVAAAREAILEGHPATQGLFPLAESLGVSPYRLSRAFTREMGVSLTRYRNRVRVAHALERLEGGEAHLGLLAADLGFADQAHLTRTLREHVGHTPTALQHLLGTAKAPRS